MSGEEVVTTGDTAPVVKGEDTVPVVEETIKESTEGGTSGEESETTVAERPEETTAESSGDSMDGDSGDTAASTPEDSTIKSEDAITETLVDSSTEKSEDSAAVVSEDDDAETEDDDDTIIREGDDDSITETSEEVIREAPELLVSGGIKKYAFHKVLQLPSTLQPDAFYFVYKDEKLQTYLTTSTGEAKEIYGDKNIKRDFDYLLNSVNFVEVTEHESTISESSAKGYRFIYCKDQEELFYMKGTEKVSITLGIRDNMGEIQHKGEYAQYWTKKEW